MATAEQLVQQVRFGLETLRERNGHHEFEAICLGVARRRIVSNLLPATGPVSSGGDQGRDAESHWTNLPNEIGSASVFAGTATAEHVALACTMQRDNVPTKVRADLKSICESSLPVDRVIYFTVTPLQVAKRHELQEEALRDRRVKLDVWDAQALAHALSDSDLFYLAVQYLHLPSELSPAPQETDDELPAWYVTDRTRWRNRVEGANTLGELLNLRRPLRYATFHAEARGDLADWLSYARAMLTAATDEDVSLRCRYEIAVATLRGTNTLRPADDLVRAFFTEVIDTDVDTGLLQDAVVLSQYCFGAYMQGLTTVTLDDLRDWHTRLRDRICGLLEQNPYPNAEAHLLALSAMLALHPSLTEVPDADAQLLPTPVEASEHVLEMIEADLPLHIGSDLEFVDRDRGMDNLVRLCRQLADTPLFPVENIADYFDLVALAVADHPHYREVRDGLDEAVALLAGHAAKADRARTRGMRFLAANRLLEALAEIHEAKVNWWQGDTVHGAVLAMLLAADIYSQLRLPLAAKQHALAAAVAANASYDADLKILVPRCLALAASYDYQAGSWLTATHTFRATILGQAALVDDPGNLDRHSEFADMLTYQSMILKTARDLRPALTEPIEAVLQSTGINTTIDAILQGTDDQPDLSEADWARIADEGGGGRPFSDVGPTRKYTWAALGMTWRVTTANERAATLAAERFSAAAQVVLAELATDTAVLLPGNVHIEVRPDAYTMPSPDTAATEPLPDNEASRWVVHLTPADRLDLDGFLREVSSALIKILLTNSLLPTDQFMDVMNRVFKRGLMHKLVMGRPYDEIADLIQTDAYRAMSQVHAVPIGAESPISPQSADELQFPTNPGPGYDQHAALALVRERYEKCTSIVQFTLPRIVNDPTFRATIHGLRIAGWRDWHILVAMANQIGNRRMKWNGINLASVTRAQLDQARDLMQRPEQAHDPKVPAGHFTEKTLCFHLQNAAMHTVQLFGLQIHQQTPDFKAILAVLGNRYGYWTDDVDHDNYFHWPRESAQPAD